ncbi:biosynthetic arginine decarboxylase [Candidatus Poribacteria bacterium]|nr:biosynthetic arginine decarboxylase [Candidatus Poribacteria bacterium]
MHPGSTRLSTLPVLKSIQKWEVQDSRDLYNIGKWGGGYFGINEAGHVCVNPTPGSGPSVDLWDLVDSLEKRALSLPILLRFPDILQHRLQDIYNAFERARAECDYGGGYICVYPIKVNQQRHVVEEYVRFADPLGFGIEAGSKPELLAVLAQTSSESMPIVCNGFKDDEFIELVVLASKMGRDITPIVEKFTELELIVKHSKRHGCKTKIGLRAKLSARGAGRWELSAGVRSKFGLTLPEILRAVEYLREHDMLDCLQMLHFHMGSQITNIRFVKSALTEAARIYAELYKLGANMRFLDVGGGLGVDYDGSQTNFDSSMNYTLQEYANDVVFRIKSVCDDAEVPHPTILSESGRAIVSYHSVLVFNVLGVSRFDSYPLPQTLPEDAPEPLLELLEMYNTASPKNIIENYHDAVQAREECTNLFNLGYLRLDLRAKAEAIFWAICSRTAKALRELPYPPEELEGLEVLLSDIFFCNFSVFQSMPDSWAIRQLFPVMPIHRLNEEPTRHGVLADITCDSDGKIDQFVDLRDVKDTLELHTYNGEPYYLAAFLIGAYQEILGDLHNLLGDTNAIHVSIEPDGNYRIDHVIEGDTVNEVLDYVQYNPKSMLARMRHCVEQSVRQGHISLEESALFIKFYESSLAGYTYLE